MKNFAFLLIILVVGVSRLLAQGQVDFNNYKVCFSPSVVAPVYDVDGTTPLGSGYLGQLYACLATDPLSALAPIGVPVPFRNHPGTGLGTGFLFGGVVNTRYSNVKLDFQLRAWDSSGGTITTYEDAVTAGKNHGLSEVIAITVFSVPSVPPVLTGLKSFNLVGRMRYPLSATVDPGSAGTVGMTPESADGKYNAGTVVMLTANPAAGYVFAGWSGDAVGSINPTTVTMDSDKTVTAHFTPVEVTRRFTSVRVVDDQVLLEWIGGGILLRANSLKGPWLEVTGVTSPYFTPKTGAATFFQIRKD